MRPRVAIAAVGAVAIVAALGACSKNTGGDDNANNTVVKQAGGIATDPADSKGPAAPVAGAKKGGTINLPQDGAFEHLDPAQIYVNNAQVFSKLLMRPLTSFKDDPKTGKTELIGDLATGPGEDISAGKKCTEWKFTVKNGVKFEDGTPVTAKDVGYNVARSFSPQLINGPHYIQQWLANSLDYNKTYKGPYDGGADLPPGVTVDGQNITFKFAKPQCDMPYAASMYTTAAVPKAKDTGVKYDERVFSDGPYKIKKYSLGTKLTLERNKYWDPKTDPIRHNYPDSFEVDFNIPVASATQRFMADNGADKNAIMQYPVPDPTQVEAISQNKKYSSRVLSGFTQFVWYMAINNERVKDVNERRAINYALDKKAWVKTLGGPNVASPASTLESPTTNGFKSYDAYPHSTAKAKELLKGKHPTLVYAYSNTAVSQKNAQTVVKSLTEAGFKVVQKQIDKGNYYTAIGKDNNSYDLYLAGWGSDWPSGSTILPSILDGRNIQPAGNYNSSYFKNKAVEAQMDKILDMPAAESAPKWAALDKEIMTKYAPLAPMYYDKAYMMVGSNVGGAYLGIASGWVELVGVYVKS